jgi:sulfotransferase
MERLYQIVKHSDDKNMLFIKFENLTNNPSKEMSRIYNYLEVPNWNHNFTNIEQITYEDDSVYGKYGDHIIKNKLVPSRSDAMTVLGPDVCNWIRNRYSWFYEKFQYR